MVLDPLITALKRHGPYLVIVILALVLTRPLASSQHWPAGHDGLRYHYLLDHFRDAVRHGCIYPRYLPNAFGGYGYPTFLYYQPAFFFAALPFSLLLDNLVVAVYLTVVALMIIGGVGAYKLCSLFADVPTALFCGCLFLITPYIQVNLFVRNDLSELMAMLLTPWGLFWLLRLRHAVITHTSVTRSMIGIGASVSAVIMAHPATSLFFVPTFCVIAVYLMIRMQTQGIVFAQCFFVAILLSCVLSAPYWVTLFQMRSCVDHHFAVGGYYRASHHVVYPTQLFSPTWGFGLSRLGTSDEMSFSLGLPHFALAIIGAVALRHRPLIQICFPAYIALILFMTPLFEQIWERLSLLHYVQFPWRILSVTAVLQVVCAAGALRPFCRSAVEQGLLLATAFSLSISWYVDQFSPSPQVIARADVELKQHRAKWLKEFYSYASADEFTPHTALALRDRNPRDNQSLVVVETGNRQIAPLAHNNPYFIAYAISPGPQSRVTINQMYIAGWLVAIDGTTVSQSTLESQLTADGRISLQLPASGSHVLQAYYAGPPWKELRDAVMLGSLILFGAFCIRHKRLAAHARTRQLTTDDEAPPTTITSAPSDHSSVVLAENVP